MRLFEAIIDANHRAVAGDTSAGLHPADYAEALPVVALTCIDPRLNPFFPNALALPAEQFIWLRNAGNIITGTMSSTLRSLALACAVKGGREIAIIGHTDCQVARTTMLVLLEKLKALGIDRSRLPDNVSEFFGTFGSERQNIIKACDFVRQSPLIGPKIPVHGLLLDLETGKLDWVVNGYETLTLQPGTAPTHPVSFATMGPLGSFPEFTMGEMKFPDMKIGEAAANLPPPATPAPASASQPPALPATPSIGSVAESVVQFAEQHWPKPSLRIAGTPSSPLPPQIKPKPQRPPPIRPNTQLRRD
jgi:carbonic anhydrase